MKAKNILLLAALATAVALTSCKSQDPFDTQSEDDAPLILKPYNESKSGSYIHWLTDENTPLVDSVVVTPSAYTTVNWYVDDVLVCTGTKINMCFSKGTHDLLIEAVTTKGKRTTRTGLIIVAPNILLEGPIDLDWDADLVKVTKDKMASVPVGSKISIYFNKPEAEYYAMRITTPAWGDPATLETDLVLQMDMADTDSPFTFTYDTRCKGIVDAKGAMSVVGFGLEITRIIYE